MWLVTEEKLKFRYPCPSITFNLSKTRRCISQIDLAHFIPNRSTIVRTDIAANIEIQSGKIDYCGMRRLYTRVMYLGSQWNLWYFLTSMEDTAEHWLTRGSRLHTYDIGISVGKMIQSSKLFFGSSFRKTRRFLNNFSRIIKQNLKILCSTSLNNVLFDHLNYCTKYRVTYQVYY